MNTSEFSAEWFSPTTLRQFLNLIAETAVFWYNAKIQAGEEPGIADFLTVARTDRDQEYIQCFFDAGTSCFHVEVRRGSADHHYATTLPDIEDTANTFLTWANDSNFDISNWTHLEFN